ncbi:MAG: phosphopantothenate/pantothenate synthetase [Methanobacteriaceae archaeon]|nr:phosphopantothenate/pantothenate synthetase [Methanobacteriaceae archaeon]
MINKDHPRYKSLQYRDKIVQAYNNKILTTSGMIAHGRGESFDYLLGEKTTDMAHIAIHIAACLFLVSSNPVISVNGNTTALVSKEIVELSNTLNIPIEINLYYRTQERVDNIKKLYTDLNVTNLLGTNEDEFIDTPDLNGPRSPVSIDGINKADLIFIPLEDGDRAEKLVQNGKKTISVDLNPLSRTAITSTVTIVDNIVRCVPLLTKEIKRLKDEPKKKLIQEIKSYNNKENLKKSTNLIKKNI